MQPSLEKLRKFFRLEHENGYANTAIIGGLAEMLGYWEGEARADRIQEEVIQAVVQRLRSYDGLSPQSRSDALRGLWKRIGDTYPEAQQKSQQQQKPRPPSGQNQQQDQPQSQADPQADGVKPEAARQEQPRREPREQWQQKPRRVDRSPQGAP